MTIKIKDLIKLLSEYPDDTPVDINGIEKEVGIVYVTEMSSDLKFITKTKLDGKPLYGRVISEQTILKVI